MTVTLDDFMFYGRIGVVKLVNAECWVKEVWMLWQFCLIS